MYKSKNILHYCGPYTGKNIGIAMLDTGIFPHIDFIFPDNRIVLFKDFVSHRGQPYDDNGHGTHIAGIMAGNGTASNKKYMGIAPKASLICGKVLNRYGNGYISYINEGIHWILSNKDAYNIRILNISVGTDVKNASLESSALVKAVEKAWDAGIVVVVAAGNNGPGEMSITSPGISKKVITVGASDDYHEIYMKGEHISNYSGRGPTRDCILKPDVIAPGSHIISCNAKYQPEEPSYASRSGTSMATPMISGAIALLLEKSPSLTNKDVKLKLKDSCDKQQLSLYQQGWGLLNIQKLLN